jgi:hypothetical protein
MCAIFVQELRLKALIINYNLCKIFFAQLWVLFGKRQC